MTSTEPAIHVPRLIEDDTYFSYAEIRCSRFGNHASFGYLAGSSSFLIAAVHHAELRMNNDRGGLGEATLEVRHPTATDFEHSRAYLASFRLVAPRLYRLEGNTVVIQAVLMETTGYPNGFDYLTASDEDTTAGICERENPAHPLMAFTPPENPDYAQFNGQAVQIELTPESLMDADGQLLGRN